MFEENPDFLGTRVDQYQVMELLGAEFATRVYKAIDTQRGGYVALKFYLSGSDPYTPDSCLEREERALRKLKDSPFIVQALGSGHHGEAPYLAREFVDVCVDNIPQADRSIHLCLSICSDAAQALEDVHANGIVHRNVKERTLLFNLSTRRAKLTDFVFCDDGSPDPFEGLIVGTPSYLSPEALAGERVERYADIFALGCTLYRLLSGRYPFEASHSRDVFRLIREGAPTPLTQHRGDLSRTIVDVVHRAIAHNPGDRYPSAADMFADLRTAITSLENNPSSAPETPAPITTKHAAIPPPRGRILRHVRKMFDVLGGNTTPLGCFDSFICYRAAGGLDAARLIREELAKQGHRAFVDLEDLGVDHFDGRLFDVIENSASFLVILTPGWLEPCKSPSDWQRLELAHALRMNRNIIPIMKDRFQFPRPEDLPLPVREFHRYNAVDYNYAHLAGTIDQILRFIMNSWKR